MEANFQKIEAAVKIEADRFETSYINALAWDYVRNEFWSLQS